MEKMDTIIQNRQEVIANIKTLCSYLDGEKGDEYKQWAVGILKRGHNMVIEIIDNHICLGPSRFVGYINNTKELHTIDHGNGNDTDRKIKEFYDLEEDDRLDQIMQDVLACYGTSSSHKKYWIPKDSTIDDILSFPISSSPATPKQYWIARVTSDDYWDDAVDLHCWLTQQRYEKQSPSAVSKIWQYVAEVKPGDVLLLTYENEIYAYGHAIVCPFPSEQVSSIARTIENKEHEFFSGIVRFKDSDVFYEDLASGCDKWGERIMVDNWHCYMNNTSVYTYGLKSHITQGVTMMSLIRIDSAYGTQKIKELQTQYENMNMFVSKTTKLLLSKHNVILQGAPGTGKTYNTAAIALKTMGINNIDLNDHAAVMNRYNSLLEKNIFFTTFHQSLDYEDFVEGLKPHVMHDASGNAVGVTYEPEDGIFKLACQAALNMPNEPVILIIDEINRGNVSKIFGELITLLEADKRLEGDHPIKVKLPYSKELFGIPSNFYIIGTMNTTDRSVGTLDYALRRRFAFVTLKADEAIIAKYYQDSEDEELGNKASVLFNDIKEFMKSPVHISGDMDIDDLMVGHSYFMAKDEEELKNKVEYEILPLLNEYINDGLLNVTNDEKKNAFYHWGLLSPIPKEEDEEEIDEEE